MSAESVLHGLRPQHVVGACKEPTKA
jgi:hypothetical protein